MFAAPLLADGRSSKISKHQKDEKEVTVFVTGSLIPQRIKVRRVGTTTVSPIRVIDRREIDSTGRQTTAGACVNDPPVRILGHRATSWRDPGFRAGLYVIRMHADCSKDG